MFEEFQSLCQTAGTERCALAGDGEVAVRVEKLLDRLRRGPIPAPSADPPGKLTYGEVLGQLFAELGHPDAWPELAEQLHQAAARDGSALATAARASFRSFWGSPNGDGFSGIWCAERALSKYFADLVAPEPGTVCRSDRQPFDPDFGLPLP